MKFELQVTDKASDARTGIITTDHGQIKTPIFMPVGTVGKETDMEVKINREIRNYTESMFFGLSLRQFIFSVLACGVAIGLYFLLRPYAGTETVSWVCILGAAPFAALGFVKYNGMTAEKAIYAWIKSEFLMPKKLVFHSTNVYYELMKPSIEQKQKDHFRESKT